MTLRRLAAAAAALLALGAAAAALAAPSAPEATKLTAKVGPGFSISLVDESGSPVSSLAPGEYAITVSDQGDEHNFHLFGPGVNETTDVGSTGTVTWNVTLTDGTYTFQCDAHGSSMRRTFKVGTGGTTTATTPAATAPAASVARLSGSVGPGFTIALRNAAGAKVKTLKRGAYTITVRDRARTHDFHLVGPGVNRKTGVAFVGTQTWKVRLGKGTLRFFCDPHKTIMRGSVSVR